MPDQNAVIESLKRVHCMRNKFRDWWVAAPDDNLPKVVWLITDWLLAGLSARENCLLIGPPGTAKTEMAAEAFKQLGLNRASNVDATLGGFSAHAGASISDIRKRWTQREDAERKQDKFFHYLLSRFTQPEELFGPVEISLLREGILAHVNFGLLTGAGVVGAVLDEVFKASSSILNALLTLMQERMYFNWGAMVPSDLMMMIGASNEMPGHFSEMGRRGGSAEDFGTLYAFLDRFAVRLPVGSVVGTNGKKDCPSDLHRAFAKAIEREQRKFKTGESFPPRSSDMPTVQDLQLIGSAMLGNGEKPLFNPRQLATFTANFMSLGCTLRASGTQLDEGRIRWTINPRKLKALYKVALAHALVTDEDFAARKAPVVKLGRDQLWVYMHNWDSPAARTELRSHVEAAVSGYVE